MFNPVYPPEFVVAKKRLQIGAPPYLLAEMACSHDGSIDRAIQMVNDAADAGFNGVQFQLFTTKNILTPRHKFYEKVRGLEIQYAEWGRIFEIARRRELDIFVNPLSFDALVELKWLGLDALKIHSADLSNPMMIDALAEFGVPISVAVGGSSLSEIGFALELLLSRGASNLLLMHGFQGYPTTVDDANLSCIPYLFETFGFNVGYQDHIDGDDEFGLILPAIASSMGAVLLEKHITDNRTRRGTDFESALDPNSQARFVRLIKDAHKARGSYDKNNLSSAESEYRKTFKKSLVASRNISAGEVLEADMVVFMRGDVLGLSPKDLPTILGKRISRAIAKYDVIQDGFFAN